MKSNTDTPNGVTADFLELRPKPGRNNNKSKIFLIKVGGLAVVANDKTPSQSGRKTPRTSR